MFGFLLGVLGSLLVFTLLLTISENIPILQIAQSTASIAIGVSAIVAINIYLTTIRRHGVEDNRMQSKEYLSEAIQAIERSYEIFTDEGRNTNPPRNDRALWLATARLIIRFRKLKEKISEEDHIVVINEYEEFWRFKYATLLFANETNFDVSYFRKGTNPYASNVVHRDSIGVIFYFSRWHDDNDDPLHGVDVIEMYAKGAIPIDFDGVKDFIEAYAPYNKKIEDRKVELEKSS